MNNIMLLALAATASGSNTPAAPPRADSPKHEQRYCVVGTITGSFLQQRECHTRAEWLDRGFDPLASTR